ncbi:MAG TPA: FAD-dependent oxidoreductase [Polyangiaceae bacterium]|jgi:nitrite reductase (NADH) large subunit|nr:FAD-dependent oxidoreductase [Polyangiaceae bacterium]
MAKKKLAIIGNGMGTSRLLDELVERGAHELYEITVYGEELGGSYNRILLGRVLGGELPDAIVTKTHEWYDAHAIRLLSGTRVKRIDTLRKNVETEGGHSRGYDLVVLATGSLPLVPPLEGMLDENGELRPGAFVYRTMGDCLRIHAHSRPGDSAVVIGGGLLGLEAAKVLSDRGLHVTVVHVATTLMNAQLDGLGGDMLGRQIERAGIFVRAGRTVAALYGDERVKGVILDDGTSLPADTVVLACGVRPRVDLARASNLPVNKGIIVNDTLATQVPGVYAFGECAEHRGKLYGIVEPVWDQAIVLADVLSGVRPQSRYRGSKLYTRLKVAGVHVASMGSLEPELESDQVFQIIEDRRNSYRKLIVRANGQLVGAMLVGNTDAAGTLVQLFDRGDPLPADPLEVLCQLRGGAGGSVDRLVCNCHKITEGALKSAIGNGADSIVAIGEVTKAGTGCGSCKTELGQLITSLRKSPPLLTAAS